MKTLYNYLVLALLIAINTSCLKAGLDELETYDQNEITNVRFEYRWWDEVANRLRVIEMEITKTIDNKSREIVCSVKYSLCKKQNSKLVISNKISGARLTISVEDNPPAIAPQEHEALEMEIKQTGLLRLKISQNKL